ATDPPVTSAPRAADAAQSITSAVVDPAGQNAEVSLALNVPGPDWNALARLLPSFAGDDPSVHVVTIDAADDRPVSPAQPVAVAPAAGFLDSLTGTTPQGATPPVVIQRGPDGRLILGSPDTNALNQLEDLIADMTPKRRDYVIFKLKHHTTFAWDVEYNLKAFFEQKEGNKPLLDWYGNLVNQKTETGQGLSRRRPLKIIGDEATKTILVQGATSDQLQTIEELIDLYDRPEMNNPQMMRTTQTFTVKYSSATVIADAIKDAFRDLLSPNDPAFEKKNERDERSQGSATTITYDYGSRYGNDKDDELPDRPQPIKFKGALSMGVDEVSNTIVVSAARGLLADIGDLIQTLDELAKPSNNIQVIPVSPSINLSALQQRLSPVLKVSRPQPNGKNGDQQNNQPGENNGDRGNGSNNAQPYRP
ncbi:MAG: hypothetical protein AB7U20_18420, partial [Planctomycetaceae bacterium]